MNLYIKNIDSNLKWDDLARSSMEGNLIYLSINYIIFRHKTLKSPDQNPCAYKFTCKSSSPLQKSHYGLGCFRSMDYLFKSNSSMC